MEKKGMPTGLFVLHPITNDKVEVWVGNYVLMAYGEGAVMAVPGHDERDFAFAKKYGLRIAQVIDVDGKPYSTDAWQPWYADYGRKRPFGRSLPELDGKDYAAAIDTVVAKLGALGVRPRSACNIACATGHLAPALLGHADPDRRMPPVRRRGRSGQRAAGGSPRRPGAGRLRLAAREDAFLLRDELPEVRRRREARHGHDGHLRRFVLVLHALREPRCRHDGGRAREVLDADGPVHRRHRARDPAPPLRALLDQGDARHGDSSRSTSRSATSSRRGWC
jgi:hypothetical protein